MDKNNKNNVCSHIRWRFFESRLKVSLRREKKGGTAQLEDLLIALADLRSFPETLCLVERGMVGDTWSTESVVVACPPSVLTLPVRDPEGDTGLKKET